jgi:hypothetical protein
MLWLGDSRGGCGERRKCTRNDTRGRPRIAPLYNARLTANVRMTPPAGNSNHASQENRVLSFFREDSP